MIDRTQWRKQVRSRLSDPEYPWGLEVWDGWRDLICDLIDKIEANGIKCEILLIKEKFGGLRLYPKYGQDDATRKLIEEAQMRSLSICERCGGAGTQLKMGGCVKTLCSPCFDKWEEEKLKRWT